jgi:hypothetical protein
MKDAVYAFMADGKIGLSTDPNCEQHNHVKKMRKMVAEGKLKPPPGEVSIANIFHDDWCNIFKGGYCNCDPAIKLEILQ